MVLYSNKMKTWQTWVGLHELCIENETQDVINTMYSINNVLLVHILNRQHNNNPEITNSSHKVCLMTFVFNFFSVLFQYLAQFPFCSFSILNRVRFYHTLCLVYRQHISWLSLTAFPSHLLSNVPYTTGNRVRFWSWNLCLVQATHYQ